MDVSEYKDRRIVPCDAVAPGKAIRAEPNLLIVNRGTVAKLTSPSALDRSQAMESLEVEEPPQEIFCLHAFGVTPEDLNNSARIDE